MRVTVIGGASFSTPALFQTLRGDFADCEFVLVGRSSARLRAVARASRLLAGDSAPHITTRVAEPHACAAALVGANVVLIQVRVGGLDGRAFDESFPLRYGLCGDEGLGAGGVSAAWRSWPAIAQWLQAIRTHAPNCLVLMMSSPVGILVRAATASFPGLNCVGICEVPHVALSEIAARLKVERGSMRFGYFGVNHLGWLYREDRERDPGSGEGRDWVREWAHHPHRAGFPSAALIEEWGGIPTKYLRLHFEAESVLASQRSMKTARAIELQRLQTSAWADYASAPAEQLRERVARRATPWYADAIVPLLRGLRDGHAPGPFFLSGPNRGHTTACAADEVLEIACRVTNGVIERISLGRSPPPRIAELVARFCQHERVATDAVLAQDPTLLEKALRSDPWVARTSHSDCALAARLAHEILEQSGSWVSVGANEQGERASGHLVGISATAAE